jgi:hypothetical protein
MILAAVFARAFIPHFACAGNQKRERSEKPGRLLHSPIYKTFWRQLGSMMIRLQRWASRDVLHPLAEGRIAPGWRS